MKLHTYLLSLIFYVTVFVIGCAATTHTPIQQELSGRPIATHGWVPMNEWGTNWQLRSNANGKLVVVGKCIRTGYDVDRKTEMWYGCYTQGGTDFDFDSREYEKSLGSLYECVKFVEHYAYGGYFI